MSAYSELYLNDAMCNLGEMLDYAVNSLRFSIGEFFGMFAFSRIGENFAIGNPKFVTGMSGVELAWKVEEECLQGFDSNTVTAPQLSLDRSPEYWAGWAYAYYQWQSGKPFKQLVREGLTIDQVLSVYHLHEADLSKFVDWADSIIYEVDPADEGARLRRLRTYWNLTQRELAEKSGVSLRMIQLYEQGQNDMTKAQSGVMCDLARALGCRVEDLIK